MYGITYENVMRVQNRLEVQLCIWQEYEIACTSYKTVDHTESYDE